MKRIATSLLVVGLLSGCGKQPPAARVLATPKLGEYVEVWAVDRFFDGDTSVKVSNASPTPMTNSPTVDPTPSAPVDVSVGSHGLVSPAMQEEGTLVPPVVSTKMTEPISDALVLSSHESTPAPSPSESAASPSPEPTPLPKKAKVRIVISIVWQSDPVKLYYYSSVPRAEADHGSLNLVTSAVTDTPTLVLEFPKGLPYARIGTVYIDPGQEIFLEPYADSLNGKIAGTWISPSKCVFLVKHPKQNGGGLYTFQWRLMSGAGEMGAHWTSRVPIDLGQATVEKTDLSSLMLLTPDADELLADGSVSSEATDLQIFPNSEAVNLPRQLN